MRRPALIAIALIALAPAESAFAQSPHWDPVTAAELADDKPKIEPTAAAEVLDYRLEIDDKNEGFDRRRYITRRLRIKIYDPARAMDVTRISVFSNGTPGPGYEIMGRLTLPDGSTQMFDRHDLTKRNVAEFAHSQGFLGSLTHKDEDAVKQQFLAVTGVVKGSVLDIWEYAPNLKSTFWMMNSIRWFNTPIRNFEYVSHHDANLKVQEREYVLNPNGGTMAHDEKAGIFTFTAHNLPSIRDEPFSPPETYYCLTIIETFEFLNRRLDSKHLSVPVPQSVPLSLGPWAYFSTAQDYQDADKGYVSSRVKEKAAELVQGAEGPREKAVAIYTYVRDLYQHYRNRADLENWYTRNIESVDELINLDQIDSTIIRDQDFDFLLLALFRAAGFESHSVYHPLRSAFPFRPELVSDQFLSKQTVAVALKDAWTLCDPCSEVPMAFGELSWDIEGQKALLAQPRQQTFLDLPSLPAEKSRQNGEADLELDPNGTLHGTCFRTFTGHAAYDARQRFREVGREQWGRIAASVLGLDESRCEVRLTNVEGLEVPEEPVRVEASVRWPSYAAVLADRMMFVLSVWTDGQLPLLDDSIRTTPVFFHYPRVESEKITVHLPQGYSPVIVPKPITATNGPFAYSLTVSYDPAKNILEVERSSTNGVVAIPVSQYSIARDWFQRVSLANDLAIPLVHNGQTASN